MLLTRQFYSEGLTSLNELRLTELENTQTVGYIKKGKHFILLTIDLILNDHIELKLSSRFVYLVLIL